MVISRKSLTIFGLALSAAIFAAGCESKKPKGFVGGGNVGASGDANGDVTATPSDTDPNPSTLPGGGTQSVQEKLSGSAYGILNFRQVTNTLQNLTGVALNAPAAAGGLTPAGEYIKALSSLPADHAPAAVTAGKVASLTKLASAYCDVLANNANLLTAKFPGLTINAVPADSAAFAKTLVDGFYGPETALQGPRATDIAIVASAVDGLKALTGATGPAVFMATCAGIVSSGEFFIY